ncbi:hypothetical protein BD324DRAFT_639092 [Kockovaella imperatae]|uniref:Uncharacterized protein n=1 Tax=Kockovaella imperatae TaxID=4999 RepID=A0A1Y1U6K1_9TREE|nr:hypothetical protein BD324DRAFT_639092 [Kockovaella imperatae]ORX33659.1 hypothetical protein BD324DRAFT_639092 [Kockovaella imperatae]
MTTSMLSTYTPPSDPPATLEKLAEALHLLLAPEPLFNFLPTALTYLATFQQIAESVFSEASEALRLEQELVRELQDRQVPESRLDEHGCLSSDEVEVLEEMVLGGENGHYSVQLAELSLRFRLYHAAVFICSSAKVDQYAPIISEYFPSSLKKSPEGSVDDRFMRTKKFEAYAQRLATYQQTVHRWLNQAQGLKKSKLTAASLMISFDPTYHAGYIQGLVEHTLDFVAKVIQHVDELQALFPEDSAEGDASDDAEFSAADVLPEDDMMSAVGGNDPRHDEVPRHEHAGAVRRNPWEDDSSGQQPGEGPDRASKGPTASMTATPKHAGKPEQQDPPDYTAPSSGGKIGSRVDKSKLKPFSNSKLKRRSFPVPSTPGRSQTVVGTRENPMEL